MEKYLDKNIAPTERAKALIKELSIDEKMAQINCYFYNPYIPNRKSIEEECPSGIGVVSALEFRNIDDLGKALSLQREMQEKIMECSPHHIPAVFHMEGICGLLLQNAPSFPAPIGRGASFDAALEREIGVELGREASAAGISHVFAPVLDVTRDARFGRMSESYGEDETLVAAMGTALTQGIQDDTGKALRTESVAKHFLGFHKGAGGHHGTDCSIGARELREVYAKPFQAAITDGDLKGVMPCYNVLDGEVVSGSKAILTGLLREEMGFRGVTVSDYCAIQNMHLVNKQADSAEDAGAQALAAGMDVEQQVPYGYANGLKNMFERGELDIDILDRSVLRVLEAKFRMGLFENPFADIKKAKEIFADSKAHTLSLQAARESMVLLKNDGILPLKKTKRIAVIGYHAGTIRGMFGGYTHMSMTEGLLSAMSTMAGVESENVNSQEQTYPDCKVVREDSCEQTFETLARRLCPQMRTLTEELRARCPDTEIVFVKGYDYAGSDQSGFAEALTAAENADVVLLALGGRCGTGAMTSMGENVNATNIGLPPAQEKFIERISELNKPLVGIHVDGRPISSDTADKYLNAILECWNPSECGSEAVVDVLLGKINPSGKLPVTVAYGAGQLPMYYSHPNGSAWHVNGMVASIAYMDSALTPRYPFGFGLSYTKFEYENLTLASKHGSPEKKIICSFTVRNNGEMYGEETAQVYVRDVSASMVRPNLELLGFCRVPLAAGEHKHVNFDIDPSNFAFLDVAMRWKIERGEYELLVGASSEDIRLRDVYTVDTDLFIDGKTRTFYTIGRVEEWK